jgi:hypothetical protein
MDLLRLAEAVVELSRVTPSIKMPLHLWIEAYTCSALLGENL